MAVASRYLANSLNNLGTETAFEVLARARQLESEGRSIVHLELGEPDFDTSKHIREAAKKAMDDGFTHYGPAPGQPPVREVLAKDMAARYGYNITPQNIVITPGAKPIMSFAIMALVNPGDEVLYPNPGFPIYESMINYVSGVPVPVPLREANDFSVDVDELAGLVTDRTKLLILNSPNNPCGSVIPKADLGRIAQLAVEKDLIVLTDEVYKHIYFEGEHSSVAQFPGMADRTIILDGTSKSYAMTGWRLGYGVFPDWLVEPVARLGINIYSCTSSFSQYAIPAAIEGPQDDRHSMVEEFKARRSIVVDGLNSIKGISCRTPKGAFYAFPNITETGLSSAEFVDKMLYDGGVALLGGTSFGKHGEGYARISFANSRENILEAIKRIDKTLNG